MAAAADVEQLLSGLVQMSVLREEGASHMGGRRFSTHPLFKELGRELWSGQLSVVSVASGICVKVFMVQ
jgi:hypothetical protein